MERRLGVRGLGPALCQGFRWVGLALPVGTVVVQSRPSLSFLLVEFSEVLPALAGDEVPGCEREDASY